MIDLTWNESFEVLAVIARKEKEKKLGLITYFGIKVEDYRGADGMPIVKVWFSPSQPINNIIVKIKTPGQIKIDLDLEDRNAEREFYHFQEEHHDLAKLATSPEDIRKLEKLKRRIIGAQKRMHRANKAVGDWHIGMGNV